MVDTTAKSGAASIPAMTQQMLQNKEKFNIMEMKQESEILRNEQLIKTQQERITKLVEVQEEIKEQLRHSPTKKADFVPVTERRVNQLELLVK